MSYYKAFNKKKLKFTGNL